MRIDDCLELIASVERDMPVDEWLVDDLHVWPIVRKTVVRLLDDLTTAAAGAPVDATLSTAMTRGPELARDWARWLGASFSDRSSNARISGNNLILLGDGYSRVLIGDRWHDRLLGPVQDAATAAGMPTLLLERNHVYHRPRDRPARWIEPLLDVHRLKAAVEKRRTRRIELPRLSDLVNRLDSVGAPPGSLSSERIAGFATVVESLAHCFQGILQRNRPLGGIVVDPDLSGLAFLLACRRERIPSTELLHAVDSGGHWFHAPWTTLPETGYELLPNVFWTWTQDEADRIDAWASETRGWHRAVAGGNPSIIRWRSGADDLVRSLDRRVDSMRPSPRAELEVLVALQRGMTEADQAMLWSIIRGSPREWRWWVRPHPLMAVDDRRRLRSSLPRRVDVPPDEVAALPLLALLRNVDVVLTWSSSTIVEAQSMGIRSVALDEQATIFYAEQFHDGTVRFAGDATTAVSAIQAQHRSGGVDSAALGDFDSLFATIAEITKPPPV